MWSVTIVTLAGQGNVPGVTYTLPETHACALWAHEFQLAIAKQTLTYRIEKSCNGVGMTGSAHRSIVSAAKVAILRRPPRRGATLILVMVIISVTLATAYALLATQGTTQQIQQNSSSRIQARQAAMAGMSIALRRMHQLDWIGCDKSFSGKLTGSERYEVTYTTGDRAYSVEDLAALVKSTNPEDWKLAMWWPLRVTVESTGYSTAGHNSNEAMHRVRTVVQLVPMRLNVMPESWSELVPQLDPVTGIINRSIQPPTIYQAASGLISVDPPVRIEGPVRLRSRLELGINLRWSNSVRQRFFADLQAMRLWGYRDCRPFNGPIYLPHNQQSATTLSLVSSSMKIPTVDVSPASLPFHTYFNPIHSYQLYPGGKQYFVSQDLHAPHTDVQNNPLGIVMVTGDVQLQSNTTVNGTIVSQGDVILNGTNIRIKPLALPALHETSEPVELPALVSLDDLRVANGAQVDIQGMVGVARKLEVSRGSSVTKFNLAGQVLLGELEIEARSNWDLTQSVWNSLLSDHGLLSPLFLLLNNLLGLQHFPLYLEDRHGLDPRPNIELRPRNDTVRYHWPLDGQSLYVPDVDDLGLRWDIVRWEDGVE